MVKKIIGVMGPGKNATKHDLKNAYEIGKYSASQGFITLTGGRNDGVMDEALRGAKENGGTTIGILPSDDKTTFSKYIDIPIITNMKSARNYINVLSSDIVVVCGIDAGTSSEISLALKAEKKVILVGLEKEANIFYSKLAPSLIFVVKEYKQAIVIIKKELK